MKKSLLYLILTVTLLGCERTDNGESTPNHRLPAGDPITSISMNIQRPSQSRVGIDIDPAAAKDTYFWTADDALILCELNAEGNTFTGNNYQYTIKSVPADHTAMAEFVGVNAVTTGNYIVLHTRNWHNVSLPAVAGTISFNIPWLEQRTALSAANPQTVQDFADNLFFSTTKVSGEQLLAGNVVLNHQLVQIDIDVTGQAADAGKRIRQVELLPGTPSGYAKSMSIDAEGTVTTTGGGSPITYVTDPTAKLGTPYKVRMLVRPTSLTENNSASVKVHCGLEYSLPSSVAPARTFEPGSIYTLAKQVGLATQPVTTTKMTPTIPYVGAFWKNDQIGERLISISTKAAALGDWTATVAWTDDNWTEGDIVLQQETEPSKPDFIDAATDTPEVISRSAVAKGTSTSSVTIFFRIGLKSKYIPTPKAPARYAIIRLSYYNNSKNHFIYLRQGEAPTIIGTGTTVEWSAYNIGNYSDPTEFGNGGFVKFPSQAGFFKKWTSDFTVYTPTGTAGSNWNADKAYTTIIANVCPSGYAIPTYSGTTSGDMHSLFNGTNAGAKDHLFGSYADGYSDRNKRTSIANYNDYRGYLVVNKTTRASLFFPCAGYRETSKQGSLTNPSRDGRYWSSSKSGTTYFSVNMTETSAARANNYSNTTTGNNGYSIRCVKSKTP